MMTLSQIRKELEDRNIQEVSRKTGISANSIYRLMKPGSKPLYITAKTISDYLEGKNQ